MEVVIMMGWIVKMLLKIMKPFAKVMIWQAIFDYLGTALEEDTTAEEPTEPAEVEEPTE
jgi:hypothetical protein